MHNRQQYVVYVTQYIPGEGIELVFIPDTMGYHERNVQREAFKLAYVCMQENPGSRHYMSNRNPTTLGTLYKVELPNGVHLTFGVSTPEKLKLATENLNNPTQKGTN